MRVWDGALTETDRQVILKGRYGKSRGLGGSPCLLIIDCQYNYIGDDLPIVEQQDRWPAGGGAAAWAAVRNIVQLRQAARDAGIPVIYSRNVQKRTLKFDAFARKSERDHSAFLEGHIGTRIVEDLTPSEDEVVIDKSYASLFFGTPLINYLVQLKIDSLIITGVSTGGCVRATAVDAVTHGFNVAIVEDCVADRIELSHKAALLDIWMKYADVIPLSEAVAYLRKLPATGS